MNQKKVLFICKNRNAAYGPSFGLYNSCKFICNALEKRGIEAKVVSVVDNNCIDKEVHDYKPTHVFIEALWVVPSKFKELIPLHPDVKWYVRVHSKVPFIAHEGIAIQWMREYIELSKEYPTLHVSANSYSVVEAFKSAYDVKVEYHPNIYCPPEYPREDEDYRFDGKIVNVGCFGAIRPMKNQLNQALAAISWGNKMKKKIRFHINADRVEQKGDSVLKNLEYAFSNTPHELVKHPWMNHHEFVKVVRNMDLGMQVSFSETFNIVAADFVWNGIPVVGSTDIEWLSFLYKADPNNIPSIKNRLYLAWYGRFIDSQFLNYMKLESYNREAVKQWLYTL